MSEKAICVSCRAPKGEHSCGICAQPVCRSCAEFLDAAAFDFLPTVPEELRHTHYCPGCFDEKVRPAQDEYAETMEKAKEAYFFFAERKHPIATIRKAQKEVRVESCPDRDETILRLAFLAVQQGFNAIVDAVVESKKVRDKAYQTSVWTGRGMPAQVDAEKLERQAQGKRR